MRVRSGAGTTSWSLACVTDSPAANSVTSWPRSTSPSQRPGHHSFGPAITMRGTASYSGATWAILMTVAAPSRSRCFSGCRTFCYPTVTESTRARCIGNRTLVDRVMGRPCRGVCVGFPPTHRDGRDAGTAAASSTSTRTTGAWPRADVARCKALVIHRHGRTSGSARTRTVTSKRSARTMPDGASTSTTRLAGQARPAKHDRVLEVGRRLPRARAKVEAVPGEEGCLVDGRSPRLPAARPRALPHRWRGLRRRRTGATAWLRSRSATCASLGTRSCSRTAKSGQEHHVTVTDQAVRKVVAMLLRRRGGGPQLLAYREGRRWRDISSATSTTSSRRSSVETCRRRTSARGMALVAAAVSLAGNTEVGSTKARRRALRSRRGRRSNSATHRPSLARRTSTHAVDRFESGETIDPRLGKPVPSVPGGVPIRGAMPSRIETSTWAARHGDEGVVGEGQRRLLCTGRHEGAAPFRHEHAQCCGDRGRIESVIRPSSTSSSPSPRP